MKIFGRAGELAVASPELEAERSSDLSSLDVTALQFHPTSGLSLSVGTSTCHVLTYDIRSASPVSVADHRYGLPIVDLQFHTAAGKLVSADRKIIKLWEIDSGEVYTSIQPPCPINGLCCVPESVLIFAAADTERVQTFYLPSL
eukprot:798142_1